MSGTYAKMKTASIMNAATIITNKIDEMTATELGSSSFSAYSNFHGWARNRHIGIAMHRNNEIIAQRCSHHTTLPFGPTYSDMASA